MNVLEIMNIKSWAVLAALQNQGDMTVKELAICLDVKVDSVRRGINELLSLEKISRMATGRGREEIYHAYPTVLPQDKDIRELCMMADMTGEDERDFTEEKWEAVLAIWEDLFPVNKRPHEKWRVRIHARELLELTGGSTLMLYERLEGIKSAPK
jgi:predicted ArsR family transcriptional regulator